MAKNLSHLAKFLGPVFSVCAGVLVITCSCVRATRAGWRTGPGFIRALFVAAVIPTGGWGVSCEQKRKLCVLRSVFSAQFLFEAGIIRVQFF